MMIVKLTDDKCRVRIDVDGEAAEMTAEDAWELGMKLRALSLAAKETLRREAEIAANPRRKLRGLETRA